LSASSDERDERLYIPHTMPELPPCSLRKISDIRTGCLQTHS
jgi:hypothetical protein